MKKLIFSLSIINLFWLSLSAQVEPIDAKIETLQKEIQTEELKNMEAEVGSERYMKYEWSQYVGEIQKAEQHEQKIKELQKELEELKAEKAKLNSPKVSEENKS